MRGNFIPQADKYRNEDLSVVPHLRTVLPKPFIEITKDGLIVRTTAEMVQ